MKNLNFIIKIQSELKKTGLAGWLFYDFKRSNDLALEFLSIPREQLFTRRWFYWIPAEGECQKVVSAVESSCLNSLPGKENPYRTWEELETILASLFKKGDCIAMEYSAKNRIPSLSKVDAGTYELIKELGATIVSSGELLQKFSSIWDERALSSHLFAAQCLINAVDFAWTWIADRLKKNQPVTEYAVQQVILNQFSENGCVSEDPPIVAVNAHSADPHYVPTKESDTPICLGDFILIDLWCKKEGPGNMYADICRVGVAASCASCKQEEIFSIVKEAQTTATELVQHSFAKDIPLTGAEVDQACRAVIESAGYGNFFIHRTGHNIGEKDHGSGAHIDSFETQDTRRLLKGTCFSIEPGIYLPGEFGIRLEYDLFVSLEGKVQITGGIQESIKTLV